MEKEFNEEEALIIIRRNIEQTKESFREKGWVYLLLGWLAFIAIVINFIMNRYTTDKNTDIIWVVFMVISGICFGLGLIKSKGSKKPGEIFISILNKNPLGYIWWGFGATLFITVLHMEELGGGAFPIMIMLFGFAAIATGGTLSIRSLIAGGSICYFLALVSFYFKGERADYRMLLLAVAVLIAFIIPGHLLRASKS